jgi:hypothetical protein
VDARLSKRFFDQNAGIIVLEILNRHRWRFVFHKNFLMLAGVRIWVAGSGITLP